jgi:hypothetical protein
MTQPIIEKSELATLCESFNGLSPGSKGQAAAFAEIIDGAVRSGTFDGEAKLADSLSVSRPTIQRWRTGRTSPHSAVMKPAVSFIKNRASEPKP